MQFNEEDQKWILAARKDLDFFQIAKILNVNESDIKSFVDSNKTNTINKPKEDKLINIEFLKKKIKDDKYQIEVAEELGLSVSALMWHLKQVHNTSWNKLKNEVVQEKTFQIKCSKCGISKDKNSFYVSKKCSIKGYSSWCRDCNKEWCKQRRDLKLRRNK